LSEKAFKCDRLVYVNGEPILSSLYAPDFTIIILANSGGLLEAIVPNEIFLKSLGGYDINSGIVYLPFVVINFNLSSSMATF